MYQTTDILEPSKYSLESVNADLLYEMSPITIRYIKLCLMFGVQNRTEGRIWSKQKFRFLFCSGVSIDT